MGWWGFSPGEVDAFGEYGLKTFLRGLACACGMRNGCQLREKPQQPPADSKVPCGMFSPFFPLLRCDGTEAGDGSAVSAILTSAVCLSFQGGEGFSVRVLF